MKNNLKRQNTSINVTRWYLEAVDEYPELGLDCGAVVAVVVKLVVDEVEVVVAVLDVALDVDVLDRVSLIGTLLSPMKFYSFKNVDSKIVYSDLSNLLLVIHHVKWFNRQSAGGLVDEAVPVFTARLHGLRVK